MGFFSSYIYHPPPSISLDDKRFNCGQEFLLIHSRLLSCSPHASHMHPPPQPGQMPPPGPPGALQGPNDPTEPMDMQRMNNMYMQARDGQMDRLEADGRAYHSVYGA